MFNFLSKIDAQNRPFARILWLGMLSFQFLGEKKVPIQNSKVWNGPKCPPFPHIQNRDKDPVWIWVADEIDHLWIVCEPQRVQRV